jgi:ornithine cyclodeaminase
MKIFSFDDVVRLLPMDECVKLMNDTLRDIAVTNSPQFLRNVIPVGDNKLMSMMPGIAGDYFGVKVISVFLGNTGTAYSSHQGAVMLFEMEHGSILAIADADAVTQIRTAAASAAATDALARPDATHAAFLGAGAEARTHIEAIRCVRNITKVTVYSRTFVSAEKFAAEVREKYQIEAKATATAAEAVAGADIISTITSSKVPLIKLADIKPGAHINAVGACAPADRELASDLVASAKLFGDCRESVFKESGDFLIPLGERLYTEQHYLGDVGEIYAGKLSGRTKDSDITIYESLGIAAEDLAAVRYLAE